jgi:protein-L-isoaspartate(D-aspartate) O-methyltransferase
MVLPLGPEDTQQLTIIDKADHGQISSRTVIPVRFGTLETAV